MACSLRERLPKPSQVIEIEVRLRKKHFLSPLNQALAYASSNAEVQAALDSIKADYPDVYRAHLEAKHASLHRLAPAWLCLNFADFWESAIRDAQFPVGSPFSLLFQDLANTWRNRAPSRQISHVGGVA
ncbi:hypothetical protein [Gluconobacter morbifer]|uniref:Uncharacterized protein n=1 Tax=Gluconobacter morbifer G707 TaxID=1088869 RepID=G6XIX4_9PROT|nr:hypothetical protein [Gluconobacter morbifer]EHH68404.1 hypothetical protein GMO_11740 [Gluconobacter morbifer G707]